MAIQQPLRYAHFGPSSSTLSGVQKLPEEIPSDYMQQVLHLLWVGQTLSQQTTGVVERLCQEVQWVTQGKARLLLRTHGNTPLQDRASETLISFSVQFGALVYGTLCIAPSSVQPTSPALPFSAGQLMAQVCSWLLYTLEQSHFLQNQCQRLAEQPYGSLTKREREVLTQMCLGFDQKSIAEKLCISLTTVGKHRQHIYEQLGVHNERDALLMAYRLGLFSILDQISLEEEHCS